MTADARTQALVVRVIDGDTLVASLGGVDTTIRLLNIDTPETKDPNKAVECLGPEASDFLKTLLPPGTSVELEYDGKKLDRYGRTLAGVWLRDVLINAEIARAGLGVPVQYNGQVKFLPPVEAAAEEAKRLEKGAYAPGVSCALPARVGVALSRISAVQEPKKANSAAYATAIGSLVAARKVGDKVRRLTRTARRTSGVTAWVFHDGVRAAQRVRVDLGLERADRRLHHFRVRTRKLKKHENAVEKARQERAQERARRKLQAERAQVARESAERQRQQQSRPPTIKKDLPKSSGKSNPPGYIGPRCYQPGGKVWHPC